MASRRTASSLNSLLYRFPCLLLISYFPTVLSECPSNRGRLTLSLGSSLPVFYLVAVLAKEKWFLDSFGFVPGDIVPALLLISLLAGLVVFWLSPLFHLLSRRHEYEADAYAAGLIKRHQPLIAALRKLNEKNLSNLTPHRLYSGFYYSHPTLLEREAALTRLAESSPAP
ncbi:MAG: M48 family metalloprotease [Limisphaerales bacterium]